MEATDRITKISSQEDLLRASLDISIGLNKGYVLRGESGRCYDIHELLDAVNKMIEGVLPHWENKGKQ
jgi:hypothetical protein